MTRANRPIFFIALRAEKGVDAIRALRGALKVLLRRFGLRAVGLSEQQKRKSRKEPDND